MVDRTLLHRPERELQVIVAAVIALMVTVAPLASTPTWEFSRRFLGSELTVRTSGDLLGAAIVAGLVGAAAVIASPAPQTRGLPALLETIAHWSLPVLWAMAMWVIAPNLQASLVRAIFASIGGVGLGLLLRLSEPRSFEQLGREGRLFIDIATYIALLALLTVLHAMHVRSAISATSAATLGALAALGLMMPSASSPWQVLAAALAAGLLLGQFTWALNYSPVAPETAGGLLLLAFYGLVGILRHAIEDKLRMRHIVEYAFVCLAGLALIAFRATIWGS